MTAMTAIDLDRPAIRPIPVKSSTRMLFLFLTLGGIAACGLSMGMGNGPRFLFVVAIGLTMTIWSYTSHPVELREDHIRIRFAPLARVQIVGYDEIESIDDANPKKASLAITAQGGERRKPVRLPMHLFAEDDRERLLDQIDEAIAA